MRLSAVDTAVGAPGPPGPPTASVMAKCMCRRALLTAVKVLGVPATEPERRRAAGDVPPRLEERGGGHGELASGLTWCTRVAVAFEGISKAKGMCRRALTMAADVLGVPLRWRERLGA